MPPKIILLTGAPPASAVTDASSTLTRFDRTFSRFLGLPDAEDSSADPAGIPQQHAAWRSLPLQRQPLHAGLTQAHHLGDADAAAGLGHDSFFTTADATSFLSAHGGGDPDDDVLADFCEQSLAHHHHHQSLDDNNDDDDDDEQSTTNTSFATNTTTTTTTTSNDTYTDPSTLHLPPRNTQLSDLRDVPPAPRILDLAPQTLTLNLVLGVISISRPRAVTTRWGRALSLVELLAGDETRSGFAVSFWLGPESSTTTTTATTTATTNAAAAAAAVDGASADVTSLRTQDVVLVTNVALHVFRGKVYGQSLRRGLTRVRLLWRRDGGGHYSTRDLNRPGPGPGPDPQRAKARAVKDWVLRFVGRGQAGAGADAGAGAGRRRRGGRKSFDQMPDDTQ
ncbi:hypothetical protein N3K66_004916 [Trichothecium roseum]|uniref:Uncharacterized protein n=1 Tax=Trichothecium roseum TaxID=47278 RepID=A0ACC0V2I1_9HYPO|nr:hypothetical protein N3K66_004916 [Trichothecium roseum]